ncbi:MAG TPA: hypothetical protein ENN46_00985, partial [Candidatus Woesearchaeota archaeon]|nr:hypothetical protein [Candidatus Woesearchaeota archaeon]
MIKMGKKIKALRSEDLPEGTMKKADVGEKSILLARVGGKLYAIESKCTHMGAELSKGRLVGKDVECPWHHSRFSLETGNVTKKAFFGLARMKGLKSFKAVEKDGEIFI